MTFSGLSQGPAASSLRRRILKISAIVLAGLLGLIDFRSIRWPARLIEGVKFYDPEGSVVLDVPSPTPAAPASRAERPASARR